MRKTIPFLLCLGMAACNSVEEPPDDQPPMEEEEEEGTPDAGPLDVEPPVVSIGSPTNAATTGPDVSFEFSANETASFACSLDGAVLPNCVSGMTVAALSPGLHSLGVVATDSAGNASYPSSVAFRVNAGPTLAEIPPIAFDEDQSSGSVPLLLGDSDTDVAALSVRVTAANESLLPPGGIVLGGSGANRTLVLTPGPDAFGQTTIVVTVSDGIAETSRTVDVAIGAVNDEPIISDVGAQAVAEDGTTAAIPFTIGDLETAASALTVTGASSNPSLITADRITLGGTNEARTVVLAPLANQTGTATITLTVFDGLASKSDTFVLTVGGSDDPPTIAAIAEQTTNEDVAKSVTVTIGDIDTAASSLTLSASYNPSFVSGVTFTGTGTSRTMTITPVANKTGTSGLTVAVSDGTGSAQSTFKLILSPVNDAPVMSVLADKEMPADGDTGNIAFTVADVDGDTLTVTSATSGDTNLGLKVTLGGTGGSRTVLVAAKAKEGGTGSVKLTVSDGTLSASRTFIVKRKIRISGVTSGPATGPVEVTGSGCSGATTCDVMPGSGPFTLEAANGAAPIIFLGWSGDCAGSELNVTFTTAPSSWRSCTASYKNVSLP
jgi:hypothetical protein